MNKLIKLIDDNLDKFMQIKYPQELFESMKYTATLPGKRLRPIMCLESCMLAGGKIEDALPAACAIEMLHAQSLIHDDLPCMDNDDFRRGKPSNHKTFGEPVALLAGDALISYGLQIILQNRKNLSDDKVLKIALEYCKAAGCFGIVAGQVADIQAENFKIADQKNPKNELEFIHKHKTATLFALALKSGAIIGDGNDEFFNDMVDFSEKFGLAFQIYDDILDEISSSESLGKTAGKDKKSGKLTYVTLYGLDLALSKFNCTIADAYDIISKYNSVVFTSVMDKLKEGTKKINGI